MAIGWASTNDYLNTDLSSMSLKLRTLLVTINLTLGLRMIFIKYYGMN